MTTAAPTRIADLPDLADEAPRRRRRWTWLVVAGAAVLLALIIASQILLPSMASDRLRDRLERQGEVSSVEVSAFPAAKLLFGQADEVDVRMERMDLAGGAGGGGGQSAIADAIERTNVAGRLDVNIGTLTAGPLTVRDARVTKRDGTLRTEALVSADALRDALPPALDLEPTATPDGELVLEGTLRARGIEIDGKADVLARDGKLILQPDGPGFIPLPSITVLDDPRLNLTDVGAQARDGDFVIRAEGTTR